MNLKLRSIIEKPEHIFLILGLFFGLISAFMMPVLTIPDEGAHFWMSYGMFSKNQQIPRDLLVSAGDSTKYVKDNTYIKKIFQNKVNLEGDSFQFNYSKEIIINPANDSRTVSSMDITRLPQAIGVMIGRLIYPSIGIMTTLGRLVNFSFFLVATYFIIKKVRYGKLAFTFLALFPMIIHQAASLSYDVINIVVIFAWVAFIMNLFVQKTTITRNQIIKLLLIGAVLVVTKPTNVLLFGFLPFLPSNLYKNTKIFRQIRKRLPRFNISKRSLILLAGSLSAIGLAVALFCFDYYLNKHGISTIKFIGVFFNTFFQTNINTQLDPIVTTGIVGNFGWLWYRLPEWLVFVHLSMLGLILLGEKTPKVNLRFAIASASLLILSVLTITVGMYFMWTLQPNVAGIDATFIQGMQGRYFTPLLILLVPTFAYVQQHASLRISPKLLNMLAIAMAIFSLTIYLLLTYIFFYQPA